MYIFVLVIVLTAYYRLQLPPTPTEAQHNLTHDDGAELGSRQQYQQHQPPPYQVAPPTYEVHDDIIENLTKHSKDAPLGGTKASESAIAYKHANNE